MFWNKYPYSNLHDLNLDWIIHKIYEVEEGYKKVIENAALKYADPLQWSITTQYASNTVVIDPTTGIAYLSVQPVPLGINITNTDYWTPVFDLSQFFSEIEGNINDIFSAIAYNNGNSTILNEAVNKDNLVIANNVLYMLTSDLNSGDAIRVGSNAEVYTVNDFVIYCMEQIRQENQEFQQDMQQEFTEVTDELRAMIEAASLDMIINVKDFGAVGDGETDDLNAFNAALLKARTDGGIIYIPSGIYMLSAEWSIGDGNAQRESSYNDITIIGEGEGNNRYISNSGNQGRTVLKRTGSDAGPMIAVRGPMTGVKISNLQLDCNGIAANGILNMHGCYCTFSHISVLRHTGTAYYSTTVAGNPVVYGAAGNRWSMIQCDDGYNGSQTCMWLTGSLSSANTNALDTCRNVIERFEFNYGLAGRGIVLEFADNNVFIEGQTYCDPETPTGTSLYLGRNANRPNFPSENTFLNCALIKGVGGRTGDANAYGAGGHWFIPYPHADGEPVPDLRGTHVLLYDGKEYFDGLQVLKQTGYIAEQITDTNLVSTWTTIAEHTLNTGETPGSFEATINIAVTGNVSVRILIDNNAIPGAYRALSNGVNSPISVFAIAYYGTGSHKITYQAAGANATIGGGYCNSRIIL